jgi:hypothetical protein
VAKNVFERSLPESAALPSAVIRTILRLALIDLSFLKLRIRVENCRQQISPLYRSSTEGKQRLMLEAVAILIILGNVGVFTLLFWDITRAAMFLRSDNAIQGAILAYLSAIFVAELVMAVTRFEIFLYALPLLPLLTRSVVAIVFYPLLPSRLANDEQQRADYRSLVIGLMPISFAGLIALTIYDAKLATDVSFGFAGYYMLISFLAFYMVLNIQSYKLKEWHGQLGDGLLDVATLSMLLSIVAILFYGGQSGFFKAVFVTVALGGWLIDHAVRLYFEGLVLKGKLP